MRITQKELDEWLRKNPSLSVQDCAEGVCPTGAKSNSGMSLEHSVSGKAASGGSADGRFVLTFTVYAHRNPRDADNLRTKELQDALVIAGFFPDDNWKIISEVRLRSRKAKSKEEERTEIEISEIS